MNSFDEFDDFWGDSEQEVKPTKPKKKKKMKGLLLGVVALLLCGTILLGAGAATVAGIFLFANKKEAVQIQSGLISGKFVDYRIMDEESARQAAKDAVVALELGNAADELTLEYAANANQLTYYRFQQNYKGLPVYGCTSVVIADSSGNSKGFSTNMVSVPSELDVSFALDTVTLQQVIAEYWGATAEQIRICGNERILYEMDTLEVCHRVSVLRDESAYKIFIVSAKNRQIMEEATPFSPAEICISEGENKEDRIEFNGAKNKDGEYVLLDLENNFYCLTANGAVTYDTEAKEWKPNCATAISSNTAEFNVAYREVFEHYRDITEIAKYYQDTYRDWGTEHFALIYKSGYTTAGGIGETIISKELQGVCGGNKEIGLIQIDAKDVADNKPNYWALAHEYTHMITNNRVHWKRGLDFANEAQAINEAYSDLFAMIINRNSKRDNDNIMWNDGEIVGRPDIRYPQAKNFFTTLNAGTMKTDDNKILYIEEPNQAYTYSNAVVLEYAAYLMSQDATPNGLNIEEIANLWYNTLLTLPSDCTYEIFRNNMEMTAKNLGFSKEKREIIDQAFDAVRVENPDTLSTEFDIYVYNKQGKSEGQYTIQINGEKKGWLIFGKGSHTEEITVTQEGPVPVQLPEGTYIITVTNGTDSYTERVTIEKKSALKTLSFTVAFRQPQSEQRLVLERLYTPDGFLMDVTSYEYNAQGLLQGKTSWHYVDYEDYWQPYTTAYAYDQAGRLIRELGADEYNITIKEYSYDSAGRLLRTVEKYNGQKDTVMEYSYDTADRIQSVTTKYQYDGIPDSEEKEVYYYDQAGRLSYTTLNGSTDFYRRFTYDQKGNLVKEEINNEYNSITNSYTYNEKNQKIRVKTDSDGYALQDTTYTYDQNGNLVTCYNKYSTHEEKTVYSYASTPSVPADTGWKKAYQSSVSRKLSEFSDNASFFLVDVDQNGIPELIAQSFIYATGTKILTYNGSRVDDYQISAGSIYYNPQKGLLCNSTGYQGVYGDTIYQVTDGAIKEIAEGSWIDPVLSEQYIWNQCSVSGKEYNDRKEMAFPLAEAIPMGTVGKDANGNTVFGPVVYSYDQLLMILSY